MSDNGSGSVESTDTGSTIVVALVYNLLLGALLMVVFIALRKKFPTFYYPKWLMAKQEEKNLYRADNERASIDSIASLSEITDFPANPHWWKDVEGILGFFRYVYKADSEKQLIEAGGIYAALYLRLQRNTGFFMLGAAFLVSAIIVPINVSVSNKANPDLDSFSKVIGAGISDGSGVFWVHTVFFAIVCMAAFYMLFKYQEWSIEIQGRTFQEGIGAEFHTVKLRRVPSHLMQYDSNSAKPALETYLRNEFPKVGRIVSVHLAPRAPQLLELRKKYDDSVKRLNHEKLYEQIKASRRKVRPTWWKFWGKKVDAINYYEGLVKQYGELLERANIGIKANDKWASGYSTGVAYVTFLHKKDAIEFFEKNKQATRAKKWYNKHEAEYTNFEDSLHFDVKMATPPEEILWDNLHVGRKEQALRRIVMSFVVIAIAMLWAIPIAILGSFSELATLPGIGSSISNFAENNPKTTAAIEGILSPLLAVLSENLVRGILTGLVISVATLTLSVIAGWEKPHTRSSLERSVNRKYYLYCFCNVVLFRTAYTSGIAFIQSHIDNSSLADSLALMNYSSIGGFFIAYFLQKALVGMSLQLLRSFNLISWFWKRRNALNIEEKHEAAQFNPFRFSVYFAKIAVYYAICFLTLVVVPVVIPFYCLLVLCRRFAEKHNMLLSLPPDSNRDARMISSTIKFTLISIIFATFAMIVFFTTKSRKDCAAFLVIVLIASVYTWIKLVKQKFVSEAKKVKEFKEGLLEPLAINDALTAFEPGDSLRISDNFYYSFCHPALKPLTLQQEPKQRYEPPPL